MPEIETLRRQVDAIDGELLRRLSRRAQLAVEIGVPKRLFRLIIRESKRAAEISSQPILVGEAPQ
jgi:chorismate mutase